MYSRDKNVEKAESLERLLIAMDRLTEVVAKDETSKEILASLKDKGAKDVKEVPSSDVRADEIRYSRMPSTSRGPSGDSAEQFNFTTMRRLNDAFKSLGGDLGAFQRTLVTAGQSGHRLKAIFDNPNLADKASGGESPLSLKAFREKYIGDMGQAAYMNKMQPDMAWVNNALKSGTSFNDAMKEANNRAKDKFSNEVMLAHMDYKEKLRQSPIRPGQPGSGGRAAVLEGQDISSLARIATVTAIAAAPLVLGKLVQAGAMAQIEGSRPFGMLNGNVATDFAMYDVNRMMGNMRVAKGISPSLSKLLESETDFQKTMEPLRTFGGNAINSFLSGSVDVVNAILKPVSNMANIINEDKKAKAILEEALSGAGMGATIGGILGGAAGSILGPGGAIAGAVWGAAAGGAGGAAIGGIGEAIGERRMRELQDKAINKPHKLHISGFAIEIEMSKVCPPRRFVP